MKKIVHCSLFIVHCLLAACGFAPMYSDGRALRVELSDIYIEPIAGTNGIDLRNHLIMNWRTPNNPGAKYALKVQLFEPVTVYKGLRRSGDATWEEVRMTAQWSLSDGENVIAKSVESAAESYTFVADLVSANAAKISAEQNAIRSIGDKIEQKVNAKLK